MKNDQTLSDSEFLRYSRQLLLEDIGPEGQRKLKGASVLIVGKQQSWSTLQLTRAAHCPACGGGL